MARANGHLVGANHETAGRDTQSPYHEQDNGATTPNHGRANNKRCIRKGVPADFDLDAPLDPYALAEGFGATQEPGQPTRYNNRELHHIQKILTLEGEVMEVRTTHHVEQHNRRVANLPVSPWPR